MTSPAFANRTTISTSNTRAKLDTWHRRSLDGMQWMRWCTGANLGHHRDMIDDNDTDMCHDENMVRVYKRTDDCHPAIASYILGILFIYHGTDAKKNHVENSPREFGPAAAIRHSPEGSSQADSCSRCCMCTWTPHNVSKTWQHRLSYFKISAGTDSGIREGRQKATKV